MEYKIKKGDTLWDIAKANGTTVDALAKANGIENPNLIYAGNTLNIPTSGTASKSGSTASGTKSGATGASSGAKNGASGTATGTKSGATGTAAYETGKPVYTQSDEVKNAYSKLVEKESEDVPEYVSKYGDRIEKLLSGLENRESFEYDFLSDPLYRNYRDNYVANGRRAAKEAAANAATLTGGYGNSYGTAASSEAYGRYMTELSGLIPSLYEAALKRYDSEGEAMLERLGLLRELEGDDYSKYRDTVSDRQDALDYLLNKYEVLYDGDYGAFEGLLSQWNTDRDYGRKKDEYEADAAYKAARDKAEDEYRALRDGIEDSFREREIAIKAASAGNGKTSSSSSSSSSSKSSSSGVTKKTVNKSSDIELGEAAQSLVLQATVSGVDKRGVTEDYIMEKAKLAKKNGDITTKEYNYIKNLF